MVPGSYCCAQLLPNFVLENKPLICSRFEVQEFRKFYPVSFFRPGLDAWEAVEEGSSRGLLPQYLDRGSGRCTEPGLSPSPWPEASLHRLSSKGVRLLPWLPRVPQETRRGSGHSLETGSGSSHSIFSAVLYESQQPQSWPGVKVRGHGPQLSKEGVSKKVTPPFIGHSW